MVSERSKVSIFILVTPTIFEGGRTCQTHFLKMTSQGFFWPSLVKIGPNVLEEMSIALKLMDERQTGDEK